MKCPMYVDRNIVLQKCQMENYFKHIQRIQEITTVNKRSYSVNENQLPHNFHIHPQSERNYQDRQFENQHLLQRLISISQGKHNIQQKKNFYELPKIPLKEGVYSPYKRKQQETILLENIRLANKISEQQSIFKKQAKLKQEIDDYLKLKSNIQRIRLPQIVQHKRKKRFHKCKDENLLYNYNTNQAELNHFREQLKQFDNAYNIGQYGSSEEFQIQQPRSLSYTNRECKPSPPNIDRENYNQSSNENKPLLNIKSNNANSNDISNNNSSNNKNNSNNNNNNNNSNTQSPQDVVSDRVKGISDAKYIDNIELPKYTNQNNNKQQELQSQNDKVETNKDKQVQQTVINDPLK